MKTRILFYTSTARNFRTTLLGYLLELQRSEQYEITLLEETLDEEIQVLLKDKNLFPAIVDMIHVGQYDTPAGPVKKEIRRLSALSESVIDNVKPSLIIATSDVHSLFELLFCRYAKAKHIFVLTISATINTGKMTEVRKWINLYNINLKFRLLPAGLDSLLLHLRNTVGYFYIHWLLALLIGKKPYTGKSNFITYKGHTGMRASNMHVVFSEKEKQIYIDSGVQKDILRIIAHPLRRELLPFLRKYVFRNDLPAIDFLVLLPAEKIGFRKQSYQLINSDEKEKVKKELVAAIAEVFPDAVIAIKPHPILSDLTLLEQEYALLSKNIRFLPSKDPIDSYIEHAKVVLELPRPVSTSLLMTTLQRPGIPVLSLDIHNEFLGDYYRDFEGVTYIDSITKFTRWLQEYRAGLVQPASPKPESREKEDDTGIEALLSHVLQGT